MMLVAPTGGEGAKRVWTTVNRDISPPPANNASSVISGRIGPTFDPKWSSFRLGRDGSAKPSGGGAPKPPGRHLSY
jgi:hypothetical protein